MAYDAAMTTMTLTRILLSAAMLTPASAYAFTFQDGQGNTIPKFDLEEQSRQFRTPDPAASAAAKAVETPFGKLEFGVQQRGTPMFGSPFASPFGSGTGNADRRHYERLFAPDAMKSLYD